MTEPRTRRQRPPLTAETLQELALHYVERFATSRSKLVEYLNRKVRERGWSGSIAPDLIALADRFAALGYIDDRGYALTKAKSLGARGYGARRVRAALRQAGITEEDRIDADHQVQSEELDSALSFARRKRIGPYASSSMEKQARDKALAAMIRAGHGFDLSRRIVELDPGDLESVTILRQNW